MKQLIAYLLTNIFVDFQGDLDLDTIREFLRNDNSPEARALLARLVADGGVEDMITVLADCLQEYIGTGINQATVQEQIRMYAES